MAKYGVIIESEIQATNIDALNKSAVCATAAVDGGGLVSLAAPTTQGEDRWTATVPATGALGGLYIAYNPSEHLTEVNGKYFSGLTQDPRDYTNIQGRTLSVFKPKVGDEIVITIDDVDSTGASAVAGDILESKNGQSKFTRVAAATGATSGSTAFKIEYVGTFPYPQAGIGMDFYKGFKAVCVAE